MPMKLSRSALITAFTLVSAPIAIAVLPTGCASDAASIGVSEDEFSSNQATLLDFNFSGEVLATSAVDPMSAINDQLLFTIGHLNENLSVGRLDKVVIGNVQTIAEGTKFKITYTAKLPVAWGSKQRVPSSYDFSLPRDMSVEGQFAFTDAYKATCVDRGAHGVDTGSMWYYYRPIAGACVLASKDIVKARATVTNSAENSTGKYPEYDRVWDDGALNMVAVFGKYETGSTANDAGIDAYNAFVARVRSDLTRYNVTSTPASPPLNPGVASPDITFNAKLPDGRTVSVTALLIDGVRSADATFNARYAQLSTNADVIAYNGHAGLGDNVRALAQKGNWKQGKYVIVFMNGCDTFAYVDGSLARTRASINPDDASGTKYMEFVTNAMPAFFSEMANSSTTLLKGLMRYDAPMTYDQIFTGIDNDQVVLVTGEEDNTFKPGTTPRVRWRGITESFSVVTGQDRRFASGRLSAGTYEFATTGTGDMNLYVKAGRLPSSRTFDCKSAGPTSSETCSITLTQSADINVLVRGKAAGNVTFTARQVD
jgi:hypothetical protein